MTITPSVLVVSERPEFINLAYEELADRARVIGCTGPAQARCNLNLGSRCPLADHSSVALVDSPGSGVFKCHWRAKSAGSYAEELQRAHPHCTVILCGAPAGDSGPTGEVITAESSYSALALINELLGTQVPGGKGERP